MKIENHKLSDVPYEESPNHSGEINPDTIIMHYTAGANASSSIRTLCDPEAKASAHVVIGRDGSITQLVPFNIKAWHAGRSSHGNRRGMNNYSIGIEMDNAGMLEKSGENFVSWFGRKYDASEVKKAQHRNEAFERYWHLFTEEQIDAAFELCKTLIAEYNIQYILGHEEVSPGRKTDPGPAFPLDKMREQLLEQDRNSDEAEEQITTGTVAVDKLNFRDAPGTAGEKISKPLLKGTKVKIVGKEGDWFRVKVEQEGWVMGRYIDKNLK